MDKSRGQDIRIYFLVFVVLEAIGIVNLMEISALGIIGVTLSSLLLSFIIGTVINLFKLLIYKLK